MNKISIINYIYNKREPVKQTIKSPETIKTKSDSKREMKSGDRSNYVVFYGKLREDRYDSKKANEIVEAYTRIIKDQSNFHINTKKAVSFKGFFDFLFSNRKKTDIEEDTRFNREKEEFLNSLNNFRDEDNGAYKLHEISSIEGILNKYNIKLIKELLEIKYKDKKRFLMRDIEDIGKFANDAEHTKIAQMLIYAKRKNMDSYRFNGKDIRIILEKANKTNIKAILELSEIEVEHKLYLNNNDREVQYNTKFEASEILNILPSINKKTMSFIKKLSQEKDENGKYRFSGKDICNICRGFKNTKKYEEALIIVNEQLKKEHKCPELYTTMHENNWEQQIAGLNNFFYNNKSGLAILASLFDRETFDKLNKLRLSHLIDTISHTKDFTYSDFELIRKLCKSKKKDGEYFTPLEKISFISIIKAHKDQKQSLDLITQQAEIGIIDLDKIKKNFFKKILTSCFFSNEEIKKISNDKINLWDIKYSYLISYELLYNPTLFEDFLKIVFLEPDFMKYIHDKKNIIGKNNSITHKKFNKYKIDYHKWIKPSEKNNVKFTIKSENIKNTEEIKKRLSIAIEHLRKSTHIRKTIDNQFPKYITNNKFMIPDEILANKKQLTQFIDTFLKQIEPIQKLARQNINNELYKQKAQNTLNKIEEIQNCYNEITNLKNQDTTDLIYDLTIKMWDRKPEKDLFQGNYSTCCIGLGEGNGKAMISYLLNTTFNMIEIFDNKTQKPIGNALCYFITENQKKPIFVIDNIELNNDIKPNKKTNMLLRNSILEYANNLLFDLTGRKDIPIALGNRANDLTTSDLETTKKNISVLGEISCSEIYLDLFGNWVNKKGLDNRLIYMLMLKK